MAPALPPLGLDADAPRGRWNAITDVPGLAVGHVTLRQGDIHTGVTAILPHGGNLYRRKPMAAAHVINGFGKAAGLAQVAELGEVETPILLTNTLSVPACSQALIADAIARNPDIGRETATVNPVVGECNDGPLNDIQAMALTPDHAAQALAAARTGPVAQGSVGAGTGMTCFGFKGGIGSASRRVTTAGMVRHLGVLVLANFGEPGALILPDGRRPVPPGMAQEGPERGSVIVVLATDAPLEHRQLHRICRRAGVGLARLGSYWGHGSGDFVLGLGTATCRDHDGNGALQPIERLNEALIDAYFRAAADATAEAVLNALWAAGDFTGRGGARRTGLAALLG